MRDQTNQQPAETPQAAPEELTLLGRPPDESDKAWRAWVRKNREDAPQRLEEAAKYLSGMISICFTIFLSVHEKVFEGLERAWQVNWAVPLWLLSVLLTLFVLLPMPYGVNVDSASSIERALRRIVRVKYSLLIAAMLLFVVALGMLAGLYVYGVNRG